MAESMHNDALTPDIGGYNDAIADMYDRATEAEDWSSVNNKAAQALRRHTTGTQQPTVLDLGAGTGKTIDAVLASVEPSRIVAVDASAKMLDHLRRKHPFSAIETVQAKIEDYVATSTETFDIITAIGSFEFVENLPQVLGRLAIRLRPNGLLAATYISREPTIASESEKTFQVTSLGQAFTEYYWRENEIVRSLTTNGLTVRHEPPFPAYQRGTEAVAYVFVAATRPPEAETGS